MDRSTLFAALRAAWKRPAAPPVEWAADDLAECVAAAWRDQNDGRHGTGPAPGERYVVRQVLAFVDPQDPAGAPPREYLQFDRFGEHTVFDVSFFRRVTLRADAAAAADPAFAAAIGQHQEAA